MRLGVKAKLTVGVGLAAAGIFGFLGVRDLARPTEAPARTVEKEASNAPLSATVVLAATTRVIRTGETITSDMIRNAVYDPGRFPGVATPAEVIGQVATRDIAPNTLIPRSALGRESKLAIRVPIGMRAFSIDTTAEIAVAGLVRPGDKVDVQVVYPGEDAISGSRGNGSSRANTLLQMVPVLAVGDVVIGTQPQQGGVSGAVASATGSSDSATQQQQSASTTQAARTVTLALTPTQVAQLSLAKSVGALILSLRNPEDNDQVQVAQIASSPNRAPVMAQAPVHQAVAAPDRRAPPAPRAPASRPIELVVGGNREVIYSGSGAN